MVAQHRLHSAAPLRFSSLVPLDDSNPSGAKVDMK